MPPYAMENVCVDCAIRLTELIRMNAVANPIPARHKNVNRAEVCDQNFSEFVQKLGRHVLSKKAKSDDAPDFAEQGPMHASRIFVELFDSQLISRHLDLMARVLRVKNKVFYTIGSSGHEGNVMIARLTRHTRPRIPALPLRRVHGGTIPQIAQL